MKIKEQILKALFEIKKPIRNIIMIVPLITMTAIVKIGLIMSEDIIAGDPFKVWVWAVSMFMLISLMALIELNLEGFFSIVGGVLLLMVLLPVEYFKPQIASIVFGVGFLGYIIYQVNKIPSHNHRNRK